jgi:hypothetical protein
MEYQENYKRNEKILILPHNTLRVVDAMYQLEIIARNTKQIPDFEENLYKCVNRKEKDLSKIFNIPKDIQDKFNNNWAYYWDIAPRTNLYEYIKIVSEQKFTDDVTVLFSDKNAKDDVFKSDYYDGTIDSLEKYIEVNRITAIVMDDIDLLVEITNRKKVNLNNLSFIISRIGYNYELNEMVQIPMPKQVLYDVEKQYYLEVAMIALFDFPKSLIEKMSGGIKNG